MQQSNYNCGVGINIHSSSIPPYKLPNQYYNHTFSYFYGRKYEINILNKFYSDNQNNVRFQIVGIGGIGKSELISQFLSLYKSNFSEIHYWKWPDKCYTKISFQKSWLNSITVISKFKRLNSYFNKLKYDMSNLEPTNQLLIIDNIPENLDEELIEFVDNFLQNFNCHILIGSRKKYFSFPYIELNALHPIAARQLFEHCWGHKVENSDEELYQSLLLWCDSHTLTLELSGLTLKHLNQSLDWLISQLSKSGVEFTKLKIKPIKYSLKRNTPEGHISTLFSLQRNNTASQINLLKNMALFPALFIDYRQLAFWLNYNEEILCSELIDLSEKGYIKFIKGIIKIHTLIAYVTIKDLRPKWKDCSQLANSLSISMNTNLQKNEHPAYNQNLVPFARNLIEYFYNVRSFDFAKLCERIGYYNFCNGFDQIGLSDYLLSIEILKSLKCKDLLLGRCLNGAALCCRRTYQFKLCLHYHFEALKFYKEQKAPIIDIAEVYNDLGLAYYDMGRYTSKKELNYKKSLILFKYSLKLNLQQITIRSSFDIATTFYNIGLIYYEKNEYIKALTFFKLALKKRLKIFTNPDHVDILVTKFQIGQTYLQLKNPNGYHIMEEITKKWEEAFGENNPGTIAKRNYLKEIRNNLFIENTLK